MNKKFFYKYWYYFLVGIMVIIISFVLIFNQKSNKDSLNSVSNFNNKIILFGDSKISINQGEEYIEPGYYGFINGKVIQDGIIVENKVDVNKPGNYYITYSFNNLSVKREIEVNSLPEENIYLYLKGQKEVTIYVGDNYQDLGAIAYNNKREDISNNIIVANNVNTSIPGTYEVKYTLNYNNKIETITRKVVVENSVKNDLSLKLNYDNNTITNSEVSIQINVLGNNYSHIKLPNGVVSKNNELIYKVNENGKYYFYAFDTNGNYKVESIDINNIDKIKPDGVCLATISNDKTVIQVTAYDKSGISKYVYNNNYSSTSSKFTISSKLSQANVTIYDYAGNYKTIHCQIEENRDDYIEMHFIAGVSDDDAILIRTRDKTIMIDGGRWKARTKVVSYLQKIGVKKIDALIGSHVHWNHVQSQAEILDNFEVDKVYYSVNPLNCVSKSQCKSDDVKYLKDKLIEKNIAPTILKSKDSLKIGDMKLYFIGPIRGKLTTYQNANSLVFILQYGENKYMFPGDTPDSYMDTIKFQNNSLYFKMNLDIDVLKWPHHGYETLTDAFFKATTPKYAIITNCCSCSSKYPNSTNKKLMKKYGTAYYQVCDSKNIVLVSDGKNISIKTKQDPNDWNM